MKLEKVPLLLVRMAEGALQSAKEESRRVA